MSSANVVQVTDANFEKEVLNSDLPVLVDFWATWCAPCRAIAPLVDTLADENVGKLKVVKLDVQNNQKTAVNFQVTNIPMLLVFKNGKVVGQKVGAGGGLQGLRGLVQGHIG